MFINNLQEAKAFDADFIIIGAGHAGLSLALELDRLGLKALVLESGLKGPSKGHQDLALADQIDLARHDDMAIATQRSLGGTSNLWGTRCQPYDPIDFQPRKRYCSASWPISRDEITPYFSRAADILAISAPAFSTPVAGHSPKTASFDINRLERFSSLPAIQNAHVDAITNSLRIAILLDATLVDADFDGSLLKTIYVSGLKRQPEAMPAKRVILATGGVETTRLLLALKRKQPDLAGDDALGRYYMGHLIGEVADIRLDSPILDEALDFAIDSLGTYARHRLIPSDDLQNDENLPNTAFWPVLPPISDARHGDAFLSLFFLIFAFPPLGRLIAPEAIRKRHVPEGTPIWPHVRNILRRPWRAIWLGVSFGKKRYLSKVKIPGFFLRNPGRRYGLSYHAEQSPRPDSRITLSSQSDALGLPRVNIDLRFAREDAEALLRAHQALDRWLRAEGLGRVEYRQPVEETVDAIMALAAHGTHQIGTVRMAATPQEGCVDRDLKVFGSDNLYICSAAAFPTSGQCNPTFTIVAMALRLADHLAKGVARK